MANRYGWWYCPRCREKSYKQLTRDGKPIWKHCVMCPPTPRPVKIRRGYGNPNKGQTDD